MKKLNIILILSLTINLVYSQNNWTESLTGFDTSYNPASVAIDDNNIIFLLGYKYDSNTNKYVSCLYKSTDNASSWINITPTDLSNLGCAYSINNINGKLIITGSNKNANSGVIYISSNSGVNWCESQTGFDTSYNPASVTIDENNTLFLLGYKYDSNTNKYVSCLYKSTDNASTWINITPTDLSNLGFAFSINNINGKLIITGSNKSDYAGAIYISSNSGVNWTESQTGFDTSYNPASVTIDENNTLFLLGFKYDININKYVSCLYKSTDNASSWANITPPDLSNIGCAYSIKSIIGKLIITGSNKSASASTIYISNNTTTNLNNNYSDKALVYPNPVQDYLTIKTVNLEANKIIAEIYDLYGNKVIDHKNSNEQGDFQIFMGDLPPGVFFAKIRLENKSFEYILIKK